MKSLILIVFGLFCCGNFGTLALTCPGEGWTLLDEKCIKSFRSPMTMEQGADVCAAEAIPQSDIAPPQLLEITSTQEQLGIEGFLWRHPETPGIWLGAQRTGMNSTFEWSNQKRIVYTNWAPRTPSNNTVRGCAQVSSLGGMDNAEVLGQWEDVMCSRGNWVICEKIPPMSYPEVVLAIRTLLRRDVFNDDEFKLLNQTLAQLATQHEDDILTLSLNTTQKFDTVIAQHDQDVTALSGRQDTLSSDLNVLSTSITEQFGAVAVSLDTLEARVDALSTNSSVELDSLTNSLNTLNATVVALSANTSAQFTNLTSSLTTLNTTVVGIQANVSTLRTDVTSLRTDLNALSANVSAIIARPQSVPVGYIYTQLPNEALPTTLWPATTWSDISATHAGKFFRVLGGNSSTWGTTQAAASPRITRIEVSRTGSGQHAEVMNINYGGTTAVFTTGSNYDILGAHVHMDITASGDEVRPINTAVRIWKRT